MEEVRNIVRLSAGAMLLLVFLIAQRGSAQEVYFPPVNPAAQWDTVSPASLHWCTGSIQPLYEFLEQENTKGFLVLKNGKIVLEKYFGSFTSDSLWYWASAGKTLTSFLVGKAQEEGYLSIADTTSKFLGPGWTGCSSAMEEKITVRHQLTMTTGLDDGVTDNHCTLDTCLLCLADAGTRWAYHNAPYTLLEKVLVSATGQNINTYTQQKLKPQTGITGFWFMVGYDNVFFSTVRSMARFGLLMQHRGAWAADTLLHDTAYVNRMFNTSQPFNLSYGYLWWLNGKPSYMLPTVQNVFAGPLAPHAPADMVAGLGKNGQIVSISPSLGLVFVRMGNQPGSSGSEVSNQLCDQIWEKLNDVMCSAGSVADEDPDGIRPQVTRHASSHSYRVAMPHQRFDLTVFDLSGRVMFEQHDIYGSIDVYSGGYKPGVYFLRATVGGKRTFNLKLVLADP